jgi:hypothetical protein
MDENDNVNDHILHALRLIGLNLLRGMKQAEQVDILDKAGYRQREIAQLLDSTPKAISVRLSEVRKARRNKNPRRKKAPVQEKS